ncbi:MAG: 5-(carboxyamino)imidazole ribonucleotide synthase [Bacteroidia bacterium]|nr:5-(carboxyamino)imidazole ribonucleotide synthase [Bacteroidia bacterium]
MKKKHFYKDLKLGILGGGQLGRMLLQACIDFNLQACVLDPDPLSPCHYFQNGHIIGDFRSYDTVIEFGKNLDIITIEIEHVNTQALYDLVQLGIQVYPQPEIIELIQDKGKQKLFYQEHGIPTAPFRLLQENELLEKHSDFLPAVQKTRKMGYDGRGVVFLESLEDISKGFQAPSVLEKKIEVQAELSLIGARNQKGEIRLFPPIQMVFHPNAHLVEYLFSPAQVSEKVIKQTWEIVRVLLEKLKIVGLLAVEFLVDHQENVWVNEVAPRPHNSGHHTIKANFTSQFEQHLRAILNLPLGSTELKTPSVLVNILGEPNAQGVPVYVGIEEVLQIEGVHIHLYGKNLVKPLRKMGHITVQDSSLEKALEKALHVKKILKVKHQNQ